MSVVTGKKVAKSESNVSIGNDSILWPEWSDITLNKENWATPKNGSDGLFLDTQPVQLPQSLEPYQWIRAKNLTNLTEPLVVFTPSFEYPDLIENNKHILHSENVNIANFLHIFKTSRPMITCKMVQSLRISRLKGVFVRWFISALINLQYCGRDGLEVSGENNNFIWNGRDQSWQGWMNVYSMNKAGRGVQHRPTVNPNGKYIVRLYFLGFWRRITVDDMVPVDEQGLPLLPRTANRSELWSMLVAKALLKLCSLTWSQDREVVDCHPVACLTENVTSAIFECCSFELNPGWCCLQLDIGYLSPQDKWDFLRKYADHFEWEAEGEQRSQGWFRLTQASRSKVNSEEKKSKDTVWTKRSKGTDPSKRSEDTGRSKKSNVTKRTKGSAQQPKVPRKPQPVILCLGLEDIKEVSSETVPGLSPCWGHFIHIAQSRDIPLDPKDVKPPLAKWKLFRWLKWAIEEGLIDPVEYFVPIRFLKVVSSLKQYDDTILNRYSYLIMESNIQNEDISYKTIPDKIDRKTKTLDASKQTSGKMFEAILPENISFWADFNKMEPFVKNIHFFYKLDYFQYTARISDRLATKQQHDQRSETKKGSRKSSPLRATFREAEFTDSYCWPQKMSNSRNEPLYIFTDSVEEKFFLINFSTFQASTEFQNGNKSKVSVVPTVKRDYLIVEKHSWLHRAKKSNCLALISTAGTKSTVMELEAGRHLLRVYCRSESHCFVTISSDTAFHLGDRKKMYQLMSTESERINQLVRHISNSVSNAYQSFGTSHYREALKVYYDSYMPPIRTTNNKSKIFHNRIHEYFIEEEVKLIRKVVPADQAAGIVRSLRIFFLNRTIGLECFNAIRMMLKAIRELNMSKGRVKALYGSMLDRDVNDRNYAATIVQSFFKMLTIRKYKAIHNPNHKQHHEVLGNLLKLAELFNYNKRESLANQLLRNMLNQHDVLYYMYPCSKDFEHTLQVQELNGMLINVKPNQWLPIVRLLMNSPSTGSGITAVDMFVNLPKYTLRVFNNKTGQEMLRLVNNVAPIRYQYNKLGYTVFGYGWSEDQAFKELPWTLNIISMKGQAMLHLLADEVPISATTVLPVLLTEELSNNYIPNKDNYVAKWSIRVQEPSVVSLRLRTSYDQVKIELRVTDAKRNVLSWVKGTSVVILPAVYLGVQRQISQTYFKTSASVKISNISTDKNHLSNENRSIEEYPVNDFEESEENEEVEDHQLYHLEAFVLEDTWPLTKSEWAIVTDIRIQPSGSIVKMKSSVSSTSRLSKSELPKKKASKQSIDSQALESPYWVLQVVIDSGSGVQVSEDRSKEKEIAQMKEVWATENPDSLQRGRELREAFLKEHELKSVPSAAESMYDKKSSTLSRKSSKRDSARTSFDCWETSTLNLERRTPKPTASLRKLPPLNLSIYTVKDEEEDIPWVKTEQDEETLRTSRMMNIIYAKEDYLHFLEEMHVLLKNQKQKFHMLYDEHKETFWGGRTLLEHAYEERKAFIDSMRPVSVRSDSKKSKRSKKCNVNSLGSGKNKVDHVLFPYRKLLN
ncbi:androglobin [Calliopsis andreniformis]|uniref:androglobin n=1 Tax=Calliopsis andreniformis TaxID=337506 RepID=UPI003FCD8519